MALWNQPAQDTNQDKPQAVPPLSTPAPVSVVPTTGAPSARESTLKERNESVFGPGVTIDGKIEGDANVRIAGKFKGEILVKGDLAIEKGAQVNAKVNATNITLAGELNGDVKASAHVNLVESAQVVGDIKAATLTVASGARMRGHVEFGWSASEAAKFGNEKKRDGEKGEKFEMAEL